MASEISRHGCCSCSELECYGTPYFVDASCGFTLSINSFHADVRDDIPESAERMRWLKYTYPVVKTADTSHKALCEEGGNWMWKEEVTKVDVYHTATYTMDESYECVDLTHECGGTDTDLYQDREDPCADPPDNTLTANTSWEGTWSWDEGSFQCILDYEGTDINGDPVSGSLSFHGYDMPPAGAVTTTPTLDLTGLKVMETVDREWSYWDAGFKRQYDGSDSTVHGYETAAAWVYEVYSPQVEPYFEVKWEVFFRADGETEWTKVNEESWVWNDPDPPSFKFAESYTDFGDFKIDNVFHRCSPTGRWISFPGVALSTE